MKFIKSPKFIIALICIILACIPFFWMKPNEMDLGGDSTRLYFYDPISYLNNFSLYNIFPEGTGKVDPNYYFLPYVLFIDMIKYIVQSPYIVIAIFNDIKLIVGFLSMYWIVKELLSFRKENNNTNQFLFEVAAVITGLFYIFMPTMILNYDKALTSHNQVFINPLLFYLLLKLLLTNKKIFLWLFLLISFIFAPSFALTSAPPLFAFFPLAILYIVLYVVIVRKQRISLKNCILCIVLFLLLQSFQLFPQVQSLFDPGSFSNTRVFDSKSIYQEGVRYFSAVLPLAKVSVNIFLPTPILGAPWLLFIVPLVVIYGFIFNTKSKTFLLSAVFFLITFFLLTAHITDVGVSVYEQLFYIPGFSMFRNFIGQWMFVYSFFYALLFGQAFFLIISKCKKIFIIFLLFLVCIPLIISAWPFINGSLVNRDWFPPHNRHIAITMDPNYEKLLSFIKRIPDDSKLLTLPMTDPYYQVLSGSNNGVYIGSSTISYLAGKKDFDGYQIITPFSEVFLRLAREKKYTSIKRMLGLLNIHYIFYNSDPKIYDASYISFPYQYVRQSLPKSDKAYKVFIEKDLGAKKIYEIGPYAVYSIDQYYMPHIYATTKIDCYRDNKDDWFGKNFSFFDNDTSSGMMPTYFNDTGCQGNKEKLQSKISPSIIFQRINPTEYIINVRNASDPYVLTFLEQYHPAWKLFLAKGLIFNNSSIKRYFNNTVEERKHESLFFNTEFLSTLSEKPLSSTLHVVADGYANSWYITPQEVGSQKSYELILQMTDQRLFYACLGISILSFAVLLSWGIFMLFKFVKSIAIMKKRP